MAVLTLSEKLQEVQTILACKGFPIVPINLQVQSIKSGRAGEAELRTNTVRISKEYLAAHRDEIIDITLPHEVCHIYVKTYKKNAKQFHGPEFRGFMNILGLAGNTYHSMGRLSTAVKGAKTKTRFIYVTPSGKETQLTPAQHQKANRGDTFRTRDTKEPLKFTGKAIQFK